MAGLRSLGSQPPKEFVNPLPEWLARRKHKQFVGGQTQWPGEENRGRTHGGVDQSRGRQALKILQVHQR